MDGAQVLLKLQLLSSQIMAGTLQDRAEALILPFFKTFIIIIVFKKLLFGFSEKGNLFPILSCCEKFSYLSHDRSVC